MTLSYDLNVGYTNSDPIYKNIYFYKNSKIMVKIPNIAFICWFVPRKYNHWQYLIKIMSKRRFWPRVLCFSTRSFTKVPKLKIHIFSDFYHFYWSSLSKKYLVTILHKGHLGPDFDLLLIKMLLKYPNYKKYKFLYFYHAI